jgi:hypothetical protein
VRAFFNLEPVGIQSKTATPCLTTIDEACCIPSGSVSNVVLHAVGTYVADIVRSVDAESLYDARLSLNEEAGAFRNLQTGTNCHLRLKVCLPCHGTHQMNCNNKLLIIIGTILRLVYVLPMLIQNK